MSWDITDTSKYENCNNAEQLVAELFKAFDVIYRRVDRNSHTYNKMMAEFVFATKRAGELKEKNE